MVCAVAGRGAASEGCDRGGGIAAAAAAPASASTWHFAHALLSAATAHARSPQCARLSRAPMRSARMRVCRGAALACLTASWSSCSSGTASTAHTSVLLSACTNAKPLLTKYCGACVRAGVGVRGQRARARARETSFRAAGMHGRARAARARQRRRARPQGGQRRRAARSGGGGRSARLLHVLVRLQVHRQHAGLQLRHRGHVARQHAELAGGGGDGHLVHLARGGAASRRRGVGRESLYGHLLLRAPSAPGTR
jgi:hypothetical protein